MADQTQPAPTEIDWARKIQDDNIGMAFNMLRALKGHLVLNVPGNTIPENAKALIYSQLIELAKLYEPKAASL